MLDRPYPENMSVVPACRPCNASFSPHEEYLACLLECIVAGTAEPNGIARPKVKRILKQKPALLKRLAATQSQSASSFEVDVERVRAVVLKLARGHAAYELNEPRLDDPTAVSFNALADLSHDNLRAFENPPIADVWPEVGSRALLRLADDASLTANRWIVVQDDRYRYLAAQTRGGVVVRLVLRGYLGCEAVWWN